jgi:hypothetical protein
MCQGFLRQGQKQKPQKDLNRIKIARSPGQAEGWNEPFNRSRLDSAFKPILHAFRILLQRNNNSNSDTM